MIVLFQHERDGVYSQNQDYAQYYAGIFNGFINDLRNGGDIQIVIGDYNTMSFGNRTQAQQEVDFPDDQYDTSSIY